MREIIAMALALVVLRVGGERSFSAGDCAEGKCFTVHPERARFDAAQRVCEERGGHLMTVRTTAAADVLAKLLKGTSGNFWLGLKHQCSSDGLKGYKWVTGDDTSLFTNWESERPACAPLCASVSQKVQKWAERPCDDILDGYLCEFNNLGHCQPLSNDSVAYETPFGFNANQLLREIPQGTNATALPMRTRHICYEGVWSQAPWSCEVFGGGCEYKCVSQTCICQPGFKLESNRVTCSKQDESEMQMEPEVSYTKSFEGCMPGFHKEGEICVDLDECASSPCEHECYNTDGSYTCECFEGFIQSTEDMNKCEMHCAEAKCPPECDPNTPHHCKCPNGFLLDDGKMCVDHDECLDDICDHECNNTFGGYECSCNEGFVLLNDGTTCVREDSEGSGSSTPFDIFPTSRSPTDKPRAISSGSLLAITVCIVVCILLLLCLAHCTLRRFCQMHNYDVHKGQDEIYDFQQVIIDKNSTELSLPNRYFKRDT